MSAEIIRFIARPNREQEQTDFPTIAFRSAAPIDNPAMDHVDAGPCEFVRPDPCDA
jgi:hypothetical protein